MKPSSPRLPADQADRELAATRFDTTFVATAGAGTGKTSLLVERMMGAAVLPAAPVPIASQVAITFTEKAAAEMRNRLADGLERLRAIASKEAPADEESPGEGERTFARARAAGLPDAEIARRATDALADLDRALVTTIHGYCADLLRRFPREAAIDPDFRVDDGTGSVRAAREAWREWIRAELGPEGKRGALWREVLAAISPGSLWELAREIAREGHAAELPALRAGARGLEKEVRALCERAAREIEALLGEMPQRPKPLADVVAMKKAAEALSRAAKEGWEDLPASAWPTLGSGKIPQGVPEGLREPLRELRSTARQLVRLLPETRPAAWERILEALEPFAERHVRAARARGLLTFHELLLLSRDLLLRSPEIREREKRRIALLLVDELQDTDPLQYEIVFLLAERPGRFAKVPFEAEPEPGKLLVVGDPKQSIYRFRGADLGAYFDATRRLADRGARLLHLTESFRSVPAVLAPLNRLFERAFVETDVQPAYEAIAPHREGGKDAPPCVGIWAMRPLPGKPDNDALRAREGTAIAAFIARERAAGAEYRKIAILLRSTSGLHHYLRPLRERGIPFVVDGGKAFGEKTEIRGFLALLSALADPSDETSVLAALRSPYGGATDAELARHAARGGRWTLAEASFPGECPVLADAFRRLREASASVRRMPADLAVRHAAERFRAAELNAASYEGSQRAANLERLVDRIARLARAERLAFREAVLAVRREIEEEIAPEGESPLADERTDAVRVLTVHKAKGLEYDVVVVPDLLRKEQDGREDRAEASRRILPRARAALAARAKGVLGATRNAADLLRRMEDRRHEEAERVRLLYVACTRARERLILLSSEGSRGAGSWQKLLSAWQSEEEGECSRASIDPGVEVVEVDPAAEKGEPPPPPPVGPLVAGALAFRKAREKARAFAGRWAKAPSGLAPSGLSEAYAEADTDEEGGSAAPLALTLRQAQGSKGEQGYGGEVAAAAGLALHRMLERWDLRSAASLRSLLERSVAYGAERAGAPPAETRREAEAILETFLQSDLPKRLQAVEIVGREVPVMAPEKDGALLQGSIDLLYRDGKDLVIADFKTDRETGNLAEKHRGQLSAYARMVKAALGLKKAPRTEIWALREGRVLRTES